MCNNTLDDHNRPLPVQVQSLSHSRVVPLGMRRDDYILQSMSFDADIESGEGDDEVADSEEEGEEEVEDEEGLANDYIEEDSNIFDSFSIPVSRS